jgi:hypothetical protein
MRQSDSKAARFRVRTSQGGKADPGSGRQDWPGENPSTHEAARGNGNTKIHACKSKRGRRRVAATGRQKAVHLEGGPLAASPVWLSSWWVCSALVRRLREPVKANRARPRPAQGRGNGQAEKDGGTRQEAVVG